MYTREAHPKDWVKLGRASPSASVLFRFALKQFNVPALEALVYELSNPESPKYGQWMSAKEVNDFVAPPKEYVDRVMAFCAEFGAQCFAGSDFVSGNAPVAVVERMFNTKMYAFKSLDRPLKVVAHMGPHSVPPEIKEVIDFVSGLSFFPPKQGPAKRPMNKDVRGADYVVVPQTIYDQYGVPSSVLPANNANSMGVIEFSPTGSQCADSDLRQFVTDAGGYYARYYKTVGPIDPNSDVNVEATLDVEYILATAKGVNMWYWTAPSWLYEFTSTFVATTPIPSVISISYAWAESSQCEVTNGCDQFGNNGVTYVLRVNTEFAKIAARGVSVMVASGDAGAASKINYQCTNTTSPINPEFPSSSPFVTSVGATQLENEIQLTGSLAPPTCSNFGGCAKVGSETVCSTGTGALITSGGGFSIYSTTPSYQTSQVAGYLANPSAQPPRNTFNTKGRGYPDVTVVGHNYIITDGGQDMQVDGTSCSSPVFAGMIARLNAARLAAGKPVLGFLNPLLYKAATACPTCFTDITTGDNRCTMYSQCCATGFHAVKGWDAASGLGSPVFPRLAAYVATL
jgi:subtilase family serine protease